MFSISLPMQRISAKMEKEIANKQSFRHYTKPALSFRAINAHVRSQKSPRVHLGSNNVSLRSVGVDDVEAFSLISDTQLQLQLRSLQQQQQPVHLSNRTIAPTHLLSAWEEEETNNPMVQVVDAVDINNTIVGVNPRDTTRADKTIVDDGPPKYHVLVVDDSPLNRKMLSKLLKSKGYHIEEAADGQIAVDKVKQEADAGRHYDVILMDFVMPVMDGPTATAAIRSMHNNTPIFGLTGR